MSRRFLSLALATPLAVITLLALGEGGLAGFYRHHNSWGGLQVFADLVIMDLLACVWMVRDARTRGVRAWPWVGLTMVAGSFGPLAYLATARVDHHRGEMGPDPERRGVRLALAALLLGFGGLTARALMAHGYFGIWRLQFASWTTLQVLADLAILGLLALAWIVRDARSRGRSPWPWVLITLAAGSFGPLGYLLARERQRPFLT